MKLCKILIECQKKKKEETDMKQLKKLAMILLAVCLFVPCFSFFSFAADGKIMFTDHVDPAVQTGSTVEVTGVVNKTNSTMGKI